MNLQIVSLVAMGVVSFAAAGIWLAIRSRKRQHQAELERHSMTPEQLSQALVCEPQLPVFDLREPLDIRSNSELIPGAWRICPHRVLENPWLLPRKKQAVIYCTSPNDKTSRIVLERALALGLVNIKLLKGGLQAWKADGYAVEPYFRHIRLEVAT
jgi:rhodanese-related sulfurtransferase